MAKFIQSDYDTAVKCASSIKAHTKLIERCRTMEKDIVSASKSYWKGNCGDEIREGLTESRKRMQTIINEMESLADDITTVAKQLKDKDEMLSKTIGNSLGVLKDWFD